MPPYDYFSHPTFNSLVFSFSADIVLETFSLFYVIIADIKHLFCGRAERVTAARPAGVEMPPGVMAFRMIRNNHAVD